ncbi:MAG: DinB family protein [Puia sp.]|nr:DinB family protein [Puia sp.]
MNKQIEVLRNTRRHLLGFVDDLSAEELNTIPQGFNNNIIWNIAHLISTQQNVCYIRAGLGLCVDEKYFSPFKPDTKPARVIDAAEIDTIKGLFLTVIDQLEVDYAKNAFSRYTPWLNRYGVQLSTIDEVLGFIPFHEGLHYGYIMAEKRALRNQQAAGIRG